MTNLSEFLRLSCRVLVISACSAKKSTADLPSSAQLSAQELDSPILRSEGEVRLAKYARPARNMYLGQGHRYVLRAIENLRANNFSISHFIVSAGYGLIQDSQMIVPYDVTFSKASKGWIIQRGQQLTLFRTLREVADGYQRIVVILGREYLLALGLPIAAKELPPTLVYVTPAYESRVGNGIVCIVVGEVERKRIRAYSASAKEKQFCLDAEQMAKVGDQ